MNAARVPEATQMGFIPIHSRNDAFNDPGVCGTVASVEESQPFELLMKGGP